MNRISGLIQRINNEYKWVYVFVLFAPFMYSMHFQSIDTTILDDIVEYARVGWFIGISLLFVTSKKKPSRLTWLLILMQLWQLFVTCITNKKIALSIFDLSSSLSVVLIIELFLDYPEDLLKGLLLHYELAIYPNLITVISAVINHNDLFYLGDHNQVLLFYIPAMAVGYLYMHLTKNKRRCIPLIVVSLISCFLSKSSTALVAIIYSIGMILLGLFFSKKKDFSIILSFMIMMAINVFLVFFYNETVMPNLRLLIIQIFNKTMAFSAREEIWPNAIQMIKENFIIGHGYRTTVWVNWSFTAGHAHNLLLDKMLVGGIAELILFLFLHIELFNKVEKQKPNNCKLVLVALMSAIFMTYITDSYYRFWRFYVVMFLLYHLEEILNSKAVSKNEE